MSHKATTWLSDIAATEIGNSEFRVLFHLCDCHNPSAGCFPTQAYLIAACGVSNGTLNNALSALEVKGLIKRHRTRDDKSKRQKPTRYILGFELAGSQEPTPEIGDGSGGSKAPKSSRSRLQSTGDGAVSNLEGEPSPISGGSRLQPTGEVTCKEPVINQRGRAKAPYFTDDERSEAIEVAEFIKAGGTVVANAIRQRVQDCLLVGKMITDAEAAAHGIQTDRKD